MPKSPKTAYYAVRKGREPGIYLTWEECKAQVKAFPGAVFKKLATSAEANAFMQATTTPWSAATPTVASTSAATSTVRLSIDEDEFDVVYCDGACKGNGQIGSVAGVGVWWGLGDPRNLSERCPGDQTNNRAELIAIVRVLETTPPCKRKLLIKTDSKYSIQCATAWIRKWMANGFRVYDGQPVKNCALIKYLAALLHVRRVNSEVVQFEHVRGHRGLEGNEAADHLANLGTLHPPIPERDWERLEQDLLKQVPSKKSLSVDDLQVYTAAAPPMVPSTTDASREIRPAKNGGHADLETYADCLLSDGELAQLGADGSFPSDF